MRAINVIDQVVFPIDQKLRSFFCCLLRLFQRRAAQLHILNRLAGGGKIIESDLLSVIGECCVPWSGLKCENLFFILRAGSDICWLWIYPTLRQAFVLRIGRDRRSRWTRHCAGCNMRARFAREKVNRCCRRQHDKQGRASENPSPPSPSCKIDTTHTCQGALRLLKL